MGMMPVDVLLCDTKEGRFTSGVRTTLETVTNLSQSQTLPRCLVKLQEQRQYPIKSGNVFVSVMFVCAILHTVMLKPPGNIVSTSKD